jgi:hypothetical protein
MTAIDNCDSTIALACTPAADSLAPGSHTLTCTAADDAAGNAPSQQCSVQIDVADNTPPDIQCPLDVEAFADSGCQASVVVPSATATDNCDASNNIGISCTMSGTQTFSGGEHEVTCTATDTGAGGTPNSGNFFLFFTVAGLSFCFYILDLYVCVYDCNDSFVFILHSSCR